MFSKVSQNSDALAKLAALNPLAEGAAPTQAAGVSIGVAALSVAAPRDVCLLLVVTWDRECIMSARGVSTVQ